MFFTHTLLLQLPREIPGLGVEYLPESAAKITWGIFEVVFNCSIGLFGIFSLVAILLLLFSDGPWYSAGKEALGGLFLVLFLLSQYQVIYGTNFRMWNSLARTITTEEKAVEYRENWQKASDPDYLKSLSAEEKGKLPWYANWSLAAAVLSPGSVVVSEAYVALLTPIFFAQQIFIHALWRMMANLLFMFGPLCIVFGALGKKGRRVVLAWIGALLQMGLWGVWNAVMAIILNNAQVMFYQGPSEWNAAVDQISGKAQLVPNHYEQLIIMTGVMFLSVLGPIMISYLVPFIPHANFVGLGSYAVMRSAKEHTRMVAGGASGLMGHYKRGK